MSASTVRPGKYHQLLRIAEVLKTKQCTIGRAGVHPADRYQHRYTRALNCLFVMEWTDLGPGHTATDGVIPVFIGHTHFENIRVLLVVEQCLL